MSQWFALTIVDFGCVEKHLIKARPYFVYNEQGEQLFVLIIYTCILIYVKMNCTLYHWIEILSTTFKQNWIKKLEDCLHQQYCYAFFSNDNTKRNSTYNLVKSPNGLKTVIIFFFTKRVHTFWILWRVLWKALSPEL